MVACDGAPDEPAPTATTEVTATPEEPFEHPSLELPPESRAVKRLTVDMLAGSLPVVAGDTPGGKPITWRVDLDERGVQDALGEVGLARTLGKPDWIEVTAEPAEPTALYLKLMDDMARDVCDQMLLSDRVRSQEQRVLMRFANAGETEGPSVGENLRYLELRFLGERHADGDDEAVADLRAVFDAGVAAAGALPTAADEGWRAVCVALFSAPAFHLY